MPKLKVKRTARQGTSYEAKRKERILEAFGKFAHIPTSSKKFAQKKREEVRRENRSRT
jgi:hypothetical protein